MVDLETEEGRRRWKKRLERLLGYLSSLFLIYKIIREVISHL